MVDSIKNVLMRRDGLTEKEAEEQVDIAREELARRLNSGESPFDLMEEMFGLEPDYLEELL